MSYGENEEWRIEVACADYAAGYRDQQLQTVVIMHGTFGVRKKDVLVGIAPLHLDEKQSRTRSELRLWQRERVVAYSRDELHLVWTSTTENPGDEQENQ